MKIGRVYDGYEDGKSGRMVRIKVDDILPRMKMNKLAQGLWRKALEKDFKGVFEGISFYCGPKGLLDLATTKQFWDWNCETFIVGHIIDRKDTEKDPILFALRPKGFGWYAINWNYSLDISGEIRRRCLPMWRRAAKECGLTMRLNRKTGYYEYYNKKGKKVYV
ncbi:MAG: hypothetical protein J6Q22_09440 [Prevotella sp.]|nr:hypothetical protein [Prevotella sp.]